MHLRSIMEVTFNIAWISVFYAGANILFLPRICSESLKNSTTCSTNTFETLVQHDISFHCNITNMQGASWRRNMENIFAGRIDLIENDHVRLHTNNYSITVSPTKLEDEGIYTCIKDNAWVSKYRLFVMTAPSENCHKDLSTSEIWNDNMRQVMPTT